MLEYILVANSAGIMAEDFNYDLSKVLSSKLLDHLIGYTQFVNKIAHRSGTKIDYTYVNPLQDKG